MADRPANDAPYRLIDDVEFGDDVVVHPFTNLYGCRIGDRTRIGPFVEIQRGVEIGADCKIQSHTFICDGVTIEDEVFVGHGVLFINDKRPRATTGDGRAPGRRRLGAAADLVERRASIGSGAVILGGIRIGAGALVGAGAVVTRDVEPGETVVGNPARPSRPRAVPDRPRAPDAVPTAWLERAPGVRDRTRLLAYVRGRCPTRPGEGMRRESPRGRDQLLRHRQLVCRGRSRGIPGDLLARQAPRLLRPRHEGWVADTPGQSCRAESRGGSRSASSSPTRASRAPRSSSTSTGRCAGCERTTSTSTSATATTRRRRSKKRWRRSPRSCARARRAISASASGRSRRSRSRWPLPGSRNPLEPAAVLDDMAGSRARGDRALPKARNLADRLLAAFQGVLTGKYEPGRPPPADTRRRGEDELFMSAIDDRRCSSRCNGSRRSPRSSACRFPAGARLGPAEPNVASAITGASRPEQVAENAVASGTDSTRRRSDGSTRSSRARSSAKLPAGSVGAGLASALSLAGIM